MKTILVIFFFLITGVVYSQIHYVEVSPKSVKQYEHKEGYFDNAALFSFTVNTMESYSAKHCTMTGYIYDISSLKNLVSIKTGWDYEYTEVETETNSNGYFKVTFSTDNLPRLGVFVYYDGEPLNVKLSDVDISFSGSKY